MSGVSKGYSDKNLEAPAVQLYQLVMRTVRESCSTFTATEKKELRSLLVSCTRYCNIVPVRYQVFVSGASVSSSVAAVGCGL